MQNRQVEAEGVDVAAIHLLAKHLPCQQWRGFYCRKAGSFLTAPT